MRFVMGTNDYNWLERMTLSGNESVQMDELEECVTGILVRGDSSQ